MAYVRTVKTASDATAVQIVWSCHGGSREIEHFGSANDEAERELLKAAARQRLAAGQGQLDLGLDGGGSGRAAAGHLLADGLPADALSRGYDALGFGKASGGPRPASRVPGSCRRRTA